jgi:homoserine kinase
LTQRRRLVRVPASSANLGSGFDVFAAALTLQLELEVEEIGGDAAPAVDAAGLEVPEDRSNLCVRAFEHLHAADGLRFAIRSEIPLAAGLGSSAAAIVAGLTAADHMFELGLKREELLAAAAEIEGHADNVAAALYGGFVLCAQTETGPVVTQLAPPQGVEALVVIPAGEQVSTADARAALPAEVPLADATANLAAAAQLALGIERSDLGLIARGLRDRLHQPARAALYPRSLELVAEAPRLGAIGASISGAGPTVLVWCFWQDTGKVTKALDERYGDWAEVRRVPFTPLGADVPEL